MCECLLFLRWQTTFICSNWNDFRNFYVLVLFLVSLHTLVFFYRNGIFFLDKIFLQCLYSELSNRTTVIRGSELCVLCLNNNHYSLHIYRIYMQTIMIIINVSNLIFNAIYSAIIKRVRYDRENGGRRRAPSSRFLLPVRISILCAYSLRSVSFTAAPLSAALPLPSRNVHHTISHFRWLRSGRSTRIRLSNAEKDS